MRVLILIMLLVLFSTTFARELFTKGSQSFGMVSDHFGTDHSG